MAHGRLRLARWLGSAGLVAAGATFTAATRTDSFLISSFILGWGSALAAVLLGFAAALGYIALATEAPPRRLWNVAFVVAVAVIALAAAVYAAGFLVL
jgi:hypothetical protein